MKILVVAATAEEISPLLTELHLLKEMGGKLTAFKSNGLDIETLVTGPGMTAMAYALGKHLNKSYQLVLNLGIAGSFDRTYAIGSIVNVTEDHFSEMGAEDGDNFLSLAQMNLEGTDKVINKSIIRNKVLAFVPKVKGITVNTVHGNEASIKWIQKRFSPVTESMEGAAFLQACQNEDVPCAQLRTISNYVERRDKSKWNIPLAIENLNNEAIRILNAF